MELQYLKAIHIIFMTSWFAGLFFLGRMMIYYVEAEREPEVEKKALQTLLEGAQRRVWYIITLPSMVITVGAGLYLMWLTHAYLLVWFHVKMLFVIAFILYNVMLNRLRRRLLAGARPSPIKLRFLNEIPFLFLIAIVFTVMLRDAFGGLSASLILIAAFVVLGIVVKAIQRSKSPR